MKNEWQTFRFDIGPYRTCHSAVEMAISEFTKEILGNTIGENVVLFMFKIQTDQGFRSITHLQRFNFTKQPKTYDEFDLIEDQNIKILFDLLMLCEESLELVSDRYQTVLINSIVFSYKIIPTVEVKQITNKPVVENKLIRKEEVLIAKPEPLIYKGHHLPTTMDFTKWGECEISPDYKTAIVTKTTKHGRETKTEYHIKINDLTLLVDLKIGSFTAFSWEDTLNISNNNILNISNNLSTFKRIIKKNTYYFEDGKLLLNTVQKSCKNITPIKKSSYRSKEFITYDFETKTIDGEMVPYCICLYDGSNYKVFYITDYNNLNLSVKAQSDIMLEESINFLLKPKYNGYKVYTHNFSYFDGIFLMKILTSMNVVVKPIIRDGKFIETKIYYNLKNTDTNTDKEDFKPSLPLNNNNNDNSKIFKEINDKAKSCKFNISFRDSLLLLPVKLAKLSKTFGVESKDIFPYDFVNQNDVSFLYKGPVPAITNYNIEDMGETKEEKLNTWLVYSARFENKNWDLKNETIDYCKNDVKILWDILNQYSKIIFENWFVDIMKSPTISSLAFKLYRSNYLSEIEKKDIKIPAITGKVYEDIKKSYTGGAVDVSKPYGENVKVYDVKSLYPSVMLNKPVPVGNPTYFEGDILKKNYFWPTDEKPFRFFYVNVKAPQNMNEPILQIKRKIDGLTKTIAPLGSWKGWYFSEELYNAEKYGYKFEVLKGYTFNKAYIFKNYVEKLYAIKEAHPKGSPMNLNAKLLLNSLYGRFGMTPSSEEHIILPSEISTQFILDDKLEIIDVIDFKNNQELISYKPIPNPNVDKNEQENAYKNVSIVIASAITAYGRIHMSQFKNDPDIGDLLYTDTDCIAITGNLNSKQIGKGIGEMELEKSFIKVVYLAPKVYIGLLPKPTKKNPNKIGVLAVIKGINVQKKTKQFKFEDFVLLLNKGNTFTMKHNKWTRDVSNAAVIVDENDYKLIVTGTKREIIYKNNIFNDSKPLFINE